jgi:uncharacterized protein DUF4232
MTKSPDDQIDPYESRLGRRVDAFAEQVVRPIDAAAIAAAAHAGARRRTFAGRLFGSNSSIGRLGVVVAATIVAVAFGVYLIGGSGPVANSPGPETTPTNVPGAAVECRANDLSGLIMSWEGAAGHRIATIRISNDGSTSCRLPQFLRPALIDGDGHALIVGQLVPEPASITVPARATTSTMVDMANYCGAAPTPPDQALKLRMYLPDQSSIELLPTNSLPLPADPPPCNGRNAPATIEMRPLQLVSGS